MACWLGLMPSNVVRRNRNHHKDRHLLPGMIVAGLWLVIGSSLHFTARTFFED